MGHEYVGHGEGPHVVYKHPSSIDGSIGCSIIRTRLMYDVILPSMSVVGIQYAAQRSRGTEPASIGNGRAVPNVHG